MEVDQSGLCGGQQELFVSAGGVLNPVYLIVELGELACHITALVVEHMRRQHQLIAVLQVLVNKEVEQCPLHASACTTINPGAVAAQLCTALIVDHAQAFAQIHMVLRLKIKLGLFAIVMQGHVLLFAAGYHIFVRHIGQGEHQVLLLLFQAAQFSVCLFDLICQSLHSCHELGGVFPCFFHLGNFLGIGIPLCLHSLYLTGKLAALSVNVQNLIHNVIEIHFSLFNIGFYQIRVGTNQLNIQHFIIPLFFIVYLYLLVNFFEFNRSHQAL